MIDISRVAVLVLAAAGCGLAAYIAHKKAGRQKMVCYIGQDCDTVVHSEYSRFLGMPIEILGIFYYAAVAAAYLAFLAEPAAASLPALFFVLALSAAAFLFSLYLTFIQGFVLREWCEWCLTSAAICAAIFLLAFWSIPVGLFEFFTEVRTPILIFHGLAAAVGVGAATVTDVLFFKFLKDLRISAEESSILASVSQVIWLALAVLIMTGLALWLPDAERLGESSKFLVKMIVVGVIIVNGLFLNLGIAPKLIHISFGERHIHIPGELRHIRRLAFALGAISLTSWYSAFILGSLRSVAISFWPLLGLYIAVVAVAITISQIADRSLATQV
ncbi:MAG: vitamin K epoxide reductase family protein [bacterium]|nr:vitamin K epoxide reductase family protein [bacterium]